MDKYQLEQLKKLVMDLDKSLTRIKSFIDQNESEPGFDKLDDAFGFPPMASRSRPTPSAARGDFGKLPTRNPDPFASMPRPSSNSGTGNKPLDDIFSSPTNSRPSPFSGQALADSQIAQRTNTVLSPVVSKEPMPNDRPTDSPTNVQITNDVSQNLPNQNASSTQKEVEGTYDGQFLISPMGEKIEVPAAYAAKTRILFGDTVKSYFENGEQKFKVTNKQPKKTVKALTTKREGKWHVITGLGGYKISENAAEFNNLQLNQEVNVLVPENNTAVPFAAFDEIINSATSANSGNVASAPKQQPAQGNSVTPITQNQAQRSNAVTPQSQNQARPANAPQNQNAPKSAPPKPAQANKPSPSRPAGNSPRPNSQGTQSGGQRPTPQNTTNNASSDTNIDPALRVIEDFDLV